MTAYVLLTLAALFWAGNAIAGKLAAGIVSPVTLTFFRWLLCSLVLSAVARVQIRADAAALRAHGPRLFVLGAVGFAGFALALYSALHHTTALNATIEQSCMPVLIVLGSFLVFGERVTRLQLLGVATTIAGVLLTATQGQPLVLLDAGLNRGDAIMLLGVLFYGGYTIGLRHVPAVHPLSLLFALSASAALASAGFYVEECLRLGFAGPSARGWALIAYTVLLPSFASQLFYIRGVAHLGPSRAGLFINLVPVFGALMAVAFLGEQPDAHHVAGLLLVLSGIAIAERARPQPRASGQRHR